jgi:hypothetical protein
LEAIMGQAAANGIIWAMGWCLVLGGCRASVPVASPAAAGPAADDVIVVVPTCQKGAAPKSDVLVTVIWKTPLPGFQLAFATTAYGAWCAVREETKPVVVRFAVPPTGMGFGYLVFDRSGQDRWKDFHDDYPCRPGGKIRVEIETVMGEDGQIRFESTYASEGCGASGATTRTWVAPPNTSLRPPTCCFKKIREFGED